MVGDLRADYLRKGMSVSDVRSLLGPPSTFDQWPNPELEAQDRYERSHSMKEFGIPPAEYAKLFPPTPFPQEGITLGWNTGRTDSDCTSVAVYFAKGRAAAIYG